MINEKKLTIGNSYIYDLFNNHRYSWSSKLDNDLESISGDGGKVYLNRPIDEKLKSLFLEIRSRVAAKSIVGGYTIISKSKIDYDVIKSVIGSDNVIGDYATGISFKRVA